MTADPRVVHGRADALIALFLEMSELAFFGAKVLHPKTILPALEPGFRSASRTRSIPRTRHVVVGRPITAAAG